MPPNAAIAIPVSATQAGILALESYWRSEAGMRPNWNNSGRYEGGSWLPFNWYSIPATRTLLFATVGVFLLYFFTGQGGGFIGEYVPFVTRGQGLDWLARPWTLLTYPFLELPSLWILLTLYVLYSFGGMLERAWGSLNFVVLFFAAALIGGLSMALGSALLQRGVALLGLTIPLMAMVTAWAALDPEMETCFWGVPVKAKFVAAAWVALTYFQFGLSYGSPALAFFTLAAPAAAFLYVRKMPRLNLSMPGQRRPDRWAPDLRESPAPHRRPERGEERERIGGVNPLRKRQEQVEIDRLRRLLGEDDDGRPVSRN